MLENGQKKGESARGFHSEAAGAFCFVRMMKFYLPPLRNNAQGRQVYKGRNVGRKDGARKNAARFRKRQQAESRRFFGSEKPPRFFLA